MTYRLIGLCGALRKDSTNLKLLHEAARVSGADTFEIGETDLPLYNGDVEDAGLPEKVTRLADRIRAADGVVISSPEYNRGISGVIKNALDWLSRVKMPLKGKPVAVMSAADGRAGGEVAQFMLRHCLVQHGPRVLVGNAVCLADSSNQFDMEGRLKSDRYLQTLTALMEALRVEAGK